MDHQTLHEQFVVSHSIVEILLGFLTKILKLIPSDSILGHRGTLWTSIEVLPFQNILEDNKELQYHLTTPSIEYWDVEQDFLNLCLCRLCLDLQLQGVLFFIRFLYNCRIGIEIYRGQRYIILEVLENLEICVLTCWRSLIKFH